MKRSSLLCLLILALSLPVAAWPALPLEPPEFKLPESLTPGHDTVVYVEDLQQGLVHSTSGKRVEERHPPFSTFKVPNFLIALEIGVVSDEEETIPYSPERRPAQEWWPEEWPRDHTLQSAFRYSAAWAFQDLALRISPESYAGYLNHFSYGNELHEGDAFWLDRSLQISCKEQVDFLRRLLTEQFEIAPLTIEKLREAALQKEKDGFRFYGKTGAGPVKPDDFDGPFEGWFVGWLERPKGAPVVFALWTQGRSFQEIKTYRMDACLEVLRQLGYLPGDW